MLNACLKAVVREKRVPFSIISSDNELKQLIKSKLDESLAMAEDPSAKRYIHEEIFGPLRRNYGYEL